MDRLPIIGGPHARPCSTRSWRRALRAPSPRWFYLVTTPLYLVLTLATTVALATSVGLTRSGVRRGLSKPLRLATTALVSALSLLTLFVLVIQPYLGAPAARHDRSVTFLTPAVAATSASSPPTSQAPVAPASAIVLAGAFNHGPGPAP